MHPLKSRVLERSVAFPPPPPPFQQDQPSDGAAGAKSPLPSSRFASGQAGLCTLGQDLFFASVTSDNGHNSPGV